MTAVKAVIFDWAGTVLDHGSLVPMGAFDGVVDLLPVVATIRGRPVCGERP